MTRAAVVRQPKLHVRGIVAVIEIAGVTAVTGGRRSGEYVVDMACSTRQCGMRTGQRISCHLQVVKLGVEPRVHRVAAFTCSGETC